MFHESGIGERLESGRTETKFGRFLWVIFTTLYFSKVLETLSTLSIEVAVSVIYPFCRFRTTTVSFLIHTVYVNWSGISKV